MKINLLRHLKVLFELLTEAVFLFDKDCNIVWKNNSALKMNNFLDTVLLEKIKDYILNRTGFEDTVTVFLDNIKEAYLVQIDSFYVLINLNIIQSEPVKVLPLNTNDNLNMETESLLNKCIYISKIMKDTIDTAVKASKVNSNTLITGETGVGKTFLARMIHSLSSRKKGPFVTVDCGAIPPTLLESELFGYVKGAFTGADKIGKVGLLESANNGTVLFDEIAELPVELQVKLLHVIEEKRVTRIGGIKPVNLDIRIIAATNKDLQEMIYQGDFRKDLFYRLDVVSLKVPPLRERREDIPLLINYFQDMVNGKNKINKIISQEVIECLIQYDWPGNIRELQNVVERIMVMSEEEDIIQLESLPTSYVIQSRSRLLHISAMDSSVLQDKKEFIEREMIIGIIKNNRISIREASRRLGVSHTTLLRKLKKYGLDWRY